MDKIEELSSYYVAFLRAIYIIEQTCHWNARGDDFYGNHLLFERIYKSTEANIDLAAEKLIGLFGNDCITLAAQNEMINKIVSKYEDKDDLIEKALNAEKGFLEFSKEFYDKLKDQDKLSLGLDDAIMSIASDREGSVYLLQQAGDTKVNSKQSARISFLNRIKKAQENTLTDKIKNVPNAIKTETLKQLITYELNKHIKKLLAKVIINYTEAKTVNNVTTKPSCIVNLELNAQLPEQYKLDLIKLITTTIQNSKVVPHETSVSAAISP